MDTTKIIRGVVSSGRYTVTAPIVKEDYGLYLKIEGVELPQTYEVDFSNSENSGTSVTMIGNADGVLIPHQFISTGKDVFAFLYHVGQDFGRTVYKFRIPNKLRPDRTEETPTPEEQSVIDQCISALNEAVAQTAQDKADADASAQSASADAERAEEASTDAQNYATQAEQSATDAHESASQASASATASAQSASQSAQIKADVEDLVDDAQAAANASERSASNAYTYATSAERSSVNASASAQSASGYASQAQTYSQTASAKAQDASGYAQTASTKATEASQSASQALSYKTDAESAKTASQTAQGLAESARDTAVQAKNDAESARDTAQTLVDGITGKVEQIDSNTERIESLEDDRYKPYVTDSASGSIASFPDGADGLPLKSLVIDINPVQDISHGDPSPTNICPISGWTGANVTKIGKNLYDASQPLLAGILTTTGGASGTSSAQNKHTYKIPIRGGATYTYSSSVARTSAMYCCLYDATNTVIGGFSLERNTTSITFTAPENAVSVSLSLYNVDGQVIQLEIGDNATEKETYTAPTTLPISWQTEAGTVYGGKLDVLTGKLTVYPYYASYNGETLTGRWISDRDKYVSETTPTIGAQVVNIGAQGVTVQLSANQINSLYGVNNLWADSGDTMAEYRADTKLYISKKIAEAISALT